MPLFIGTIIVAVRVRYYERTFSREVLAKGDGQKRIGLSQVCVL